MAYWIVVGSPENFEIARERGFDMFGFKSTRRRETGEMRPGDKLIYYLTGVKKFAGISTVTSESYEEHNKVFKSEKKPNEDFPFRVKTKRDVALSEDQMLNVPDYVPRLDFTGKGRMKSWGMAFQGNLHKITESDYKLLEKDMRAAGKKRSSSAKPAAKDGARKTSSARKTARAAPTPARRGTARRPARRASASGRSTTRTTRRPASMGRRRSRR
jgi:predicted RNA-binding protein